jgi:hypothetical protein
VVLVLDGLRREAVAEEVSPAGVSGVVGLCVAAVQQSHPVREVRSGAVDEQVVVRPHEAEAENTPVVATDDEREQRQKRAAVGVVEVQRSLRDRASDGVIDPVGKIRSRGTGHRADGSRRRRRVQPCGQNVAVFPASDTPEKGTAGDCPRSCPPQTCP